MPRTITAHRHNCFSVINMLCSRTRTAFRSPSSRHLPCLSVQCVPSSRLPQNGAYFSHTSKHLTGNCARYSTTPPNDQTKYNWINGVERLENYLPGGHHQVMIDDLLHGGYRVVDKLGFGGYSTIWLCKDNKQERYVAVNVGISISETFWSNSRLPSTRCRLLSSGRPTASPRRYPSAASTGTHSRQMLLRAPYCRFTLGRKPRNSSWPTRTPSSSPTLARCSPPLRRRVSGGIATRPFPDEHPRPSSKPTPHCRILRASRVLEARCGRYRV